DRDLELAPPPRMWASSTRTALGVRVDGGPVAPLREKDVVLSIDGVTLAGMSAEAIDQLAEAPAGSDAEGRAVRVLRRGRIVALEIRAGLADDPASIELLPTE